VRIGADEFVHVDAPTGFSRELPAWMLQPAICDAMELGPPQVSLSALLELATVLRQPLAFSSSSPADLTGVTGMAIVRAIVEGERDPARLAHPS
jgi:hypothetical protein